MLARPLHAHRRRAAAADPRRPRQPQPTPAPVPRVAGRLAALGFNGQADCVNAYADWAHVRSDVRSQLQAADDFATSSAARGADWFRAFSATYDDSLSQRFASPGAS